MVFSFRIRNYRCSSKPLNYYKLCTLNYNQFCLTNYDISREAKFTIIEKSENVLNTTTVSDNHKDRWIKNL